VGGASGAAVGAGGGGGGGPDVASACAATIAVTGRTEPDPEWARVYAGLYPRYRALYPALRTEFAGLASLG
jgi:sugar (pentulose or hexulose) kinase